MPKKIDMTGWIMKEHGVQDSLLTVIREVEPHITTGGNKQIQYLCKCECGKEVIVKASYLRNGNTKSCGCLRKAKLMERNISNGKIIQIGDIFGKLTVIKDLGMRPQKTRNKNERWSLCQCECGSTPIEVQNQLLKNGHKKSCGCISSVGEEYIEKILKENNFQYIKEYTFSDLKSEKGKLYRYDFAIFENGKLKFLIEFDGRQHYTGPESTWKNSRTLEEIQKADNDKNNYCKKNNILLKRIPYFNLSEINLKNLLSDKWNI